MIDIHMRVLANDEGWVHNYEINGLLLSTIPTPSAGYRLGILNSDDKEKSKRGNSNKSKRDNSGGGSDHKASGDEGELVNDGIDVLHGSSKLKSSHEAGHGSLSAWLGAMKRGSTHTPGRSGNSGRLPAGGSAISERANELLQEDGL